VRKLPWLFRSENVPEKWRDTHRRAGERNELKIKSSEIA
jgi:hypothetical protein